MTRIPWRAWYGDEWLDLSFPSSWRVQAYWPNDAMAIGPEAIEAAFDEPIDGATVEALAHGKRRIAIAVDDISRPTRAARLMPPLMGRLERAGVDLDNVRIVLATGLHAPMAKEAIIKKIGQIAVDRFDVHNNFPYDNVVGLGTSVRGTPIHICRWFAETDLRIGVGSITPHGGPGFGGGAKVVIPGVAGIETITALHKPGRLKTSLVEVDDNEFRAEIEEMVLDQVGLDCILNVVGNSRREIAGLFVGDPVKAHRAGVQFAKQVYATRMPDDPVDIAVTNAYPKDTDFLQYGMALNALASITRPVVKAGGTIVIVTASPEGRGYHGLHGPGMRYNRVDGQEDVPPKPPTMRGADIVFYAPWLTRADVRGNPLFSDWQALVRHLRRQHGDQASVAVFPCGSIQLAEESV